jgi:hypothetical protein
MTSVRASIISDIVTTVGKITNLTGGAVRWSRAGTNIVIKPCAVVRWWSDRPEDGPTSRLLTHRLEVTVAVYAAPSESVSDDATSETWVAAVETAVLADRTCGGYARDLKLIESMQFPVIEGQPDIGGISRFEVVYMEAP